MRYLTDEIIQDSVNIGGKLRGHIFCLDRFGVYGELDPSAKELDKVTAFLGRRGIKFERNSRNLLWLDNISEGLKELFRK